MKRWEAINKEQERAKILIQNAWVMGLSLGFLAGVLIGCFVAGKG